MGCFAVREIDSARWQCVEHDRALDEHLSLDEALDHLRRVADARAETLDVVVQYRDGWQRRQAVTGGLGESPTGR